MAYFFVLATMNAVSCSPSHIFVTGSKKAAIMDGLVFTHSSVKTAERDNQPRIVSNNSDIPSPPYIIKVRVVVEKDKDGNLARTPSRIVEDLDIAAQFFSLIHMSFSIIEAEIVSLEIDGEPTTRDYRFDASMHSGTMSIYYVFGHPWLTPIGLSSFPWDDDLDGIFMNGVHADKFTLSHEIGHYFGLYHTFDEANIKGDYVRDTLDEDEWDEEDGSYKTYDNLMNYCKSNKRHLTAGQLERVRYYLATYRMNHLLVRSADIGTIEIDVGTEEPPVVLSNPIPFLQDN